MTLSVQALREEIDNSLPKHISRKRRVHFHDFMLEVRCFVSDVASIANHQKIHQRMRDKKLESPDGDPLPTVLNSLVREAQILCFDEFQV